MAIIYRAVKGSKLTSNELDGNFHDVDDRISAIEDAGPVSVQTIEQDPDTGSITIILTDASEHGPFIIPTSIWTDAGTWANSTPYAPNDIVRVSDVGFFLVLEAHTTPASPAEFDPDAVNSSDEPLYVQIGALPAVTNPVSFSIYGTLPSPASSDGRLLGAHIFIESHTMEADIPLAEGWLDVPASSSVGLLLEIEKNGTTIGHIEFDVDSNTPTFTFENEVQFLAGDRVALRLMETDGLAADLSITLPAVRVT